MFVQVMLVLDVRMHKAQVPMRTRYVGYEMLYAHKYISSTHTHTHTHVCTVGVCGQVHR